MRIRVLIAEDEPDAREYLGTLIREQKLGFDIVGEARHGKEALELVPELRPDVVFSDVKMPILDGIGLLTQLRERSPRIRTVIVSGYQEFDDARQALSLGVQDYLLKPVNQTALRRVMTRIAASLEEDCIKDVGALAGGLEPSGPVPQRFRVALVRWGGPSALVAAPGPPSFDGAKEAAGLWIYRGRDVHESLILADADALPQDSFEQQARGLKLSLGVRTVTTLFPEKAVPASDLAAAASELGPMLDRLVVFGQSITHWGPVVEVPMATLDPVWMQNVKWALRESAHRKLETLVRGLVASWGRGALSARQAVSQMRQTLVLAQQETPDDALGRDWEFLLEDGQGRVDSFDELADLAWNLFAGVAGLDAKSGAVDAPEFHQRIRRFLQKSFAEPLTIPVICARFKLSQTYLSRLFRRYEGCTFHEYLTRLRVEAAERMLAESSGLPLKTVAFSVGYKDPYLLSRAFKAVTGRTPSESRSRTGNSESQC